MISLLLRFYQPDSGEIRLDGTLALVRNRSNSLGGNRNRPQCHIVPPWLWNLSIGNKM